MQIDPSKTYLVRGATLARLTSQVAARTPIPGRTGVDYHGPRGFTRPNLAPAVQRAPLEVYTSGRYIHVYPGYVTAGEVTYRTALIPTMAGGRSLAQWPIPRVGIYGAGRTYVWLDLVAKPRFNSLDEFEGAPLVSAEISTSGTMRPSVTASTDLWTFHVLLGAAGGGPVTSIVNGHIIASFGLVRTSGVGPPDYPADPVIEVLVTTSRPVFYTVPEP